jgi:hypothetical protein
VAAALALPPAAQGQAEPFTETELEGLPELVGRFLRAAIAPGAPMVTTVRLALRGSIKVGRWLPFTSHEVLDPHRGFVWTARAAGVITGSDHWYQGQGATAFSLLGLVPVMRASGPDVARSAAGRAGAEGCWVPTALLPRFGVRWEQLGPAEIVSHHRLGDVDLDVHWIVDEGGRLRSARFDRWGDPDGTGAFGLHPFGIDVTGHATFSGMTIAHRGRAGWFHGTDRWADGEFFRYEITGLEPLASTAPPSAG